MAQKQYAIPQGSKVLVTAANSYIGSNIVDLLLELGFYVRGTVRTEKPWLNELFDKKYGKGRFETVIVPGAEIEGVFNDMLSDIAGIIHVGSDVSMSPDPNAVIPKVIKGVLNPLEAASKNSSVKRFVLTSSTAAALVARTNEALTVDENTWDDDAVEAAWNKDVQTAEKPFMVYAASKTEGERAAWKWIRDSNRGFVFNTVLPNMTWGRILHHEIPGSTMGWTRDLLSGDDKMLKLFPPQWYIDVQDVARLHVIALLDSDVQNERIFGCAAPYNYTDVIAILRKLRPKNKKIPDPPVNEGRDLSDMQGSRRSEELIKKFFGRPGFTSMENSLAEGIEAVQ